MPKTEERPPQQGKEEERPKKAAKRLDPRAPWWSAFMFYSDTARNEILAKNPRVGYPEVGDLLEAGWEGLGSKEKGKYEDLARKDKQRHKRKIDDYAPMSGR